MKKRLLIIPLLFLLLNACKKGSGGPDVEPVSTLRVNRSTLILSGNAVALDSFHIQTDVDWKITLSASAVGWLGVDTDHGSGSGQVRLNAFSDNLGLQERNATIEIVDVAGALPTVTVKVTQTAFVIRPFSKTWGGVKSDFFTTMVVTGDGGYAMAGYSASDDGDFAGNRGSMDLLVLRTDGEGNRIWQKTYGGSGFDAAAAMVNTADGGMLITGQTTSSDGDVQGLHGNNDFWLMKLDASGNKVWSKTYGGKGYDGAAAITATPDGGYILAGYASSSDGDVTSHLNFELNFYDVWLVKVDASGNKVWEHSYGGQGDDLATSIHAAPGGGYYVGGYTQSNNGDFTGARGADDAFLMKISEDGTLNWSNRYGGARADATQSIDVDIDGNLVLSVTTYSIDGDGEGNHGGSDLLILKTDPSGNVLWKSIFGGSSNDFAQSAISNPDGTMLLVGWGLSRDQDFATGYGANDAWVIRLDGQGHATWKKNFGGQLDDVAMTVVRDPRKGFVLAGDASSKDQDISVNHGASDAWLLKFGTP